jgi:hypothetical protein
MSLSVRGRNSSYLRGDLFEMNVGAETIEWLYGEQLKVDPEWSERIPNGFRWWADKHAQTIQVIGEDEGPDGDIGYLISVETDFLLLPALNGRPLNDRELIAINTFLMPFASMAGPVYDEYTRMLSLCSLVRIHEGIREWMNPLISVAAVLQIGEARIMAGTMAEALGAEQAISGHPQHGERPEPDEMAEVIATIIAPRGEQPCRWSVAEFTAAVEQYMQQPPSLLASAGGLGFTVEFPYGDQSSLCQVSGDQPHPRYGNGLFLLQSFPTPNLSESEGARLALTLNGEELGHKPNGYGFGSYTYRDNTIHFTAFLPNAVYRRGLLPNIYFTCAQRARAMSIRLANSDWKPESFDIRHSGIGSMLFP